MKGVPRGGPLRTRQANEIRLFGFPDNTLLSFYLHLYPTRRSNLKFGIICFSARFRIYNPGNVNRHGGK